MMTGYRPCECPACGDLAIDDPICFDCERAGCTPDSTASDCARSAEEE
jgi:hypothetical protein